MEGFFATGCVFPPATTRSEREKELPAKKSTAATQGASKPVTSDGAGADGSAEGAPVFIL